ncbi:probable RNA-dependent RNA polymerase 1 [Anneissia japonica]|uniref:probable RNA-dependent RNA polymerase 1 n=1 Tax=Anneissia japonica TaxID=1529436 RepID=UPI0014255213|nr:probable RNA-dependent RNA polymerase 1 [Anneissia japonica]
MAVKPSLRTTTFEVLFQTKSDIPTDDILTKIDWNLTLKVNSISKIAEWRHFGNLLHIWHVKMTSDLAVSECFEEVRQQWCRKKLIYFPWLRPVSKDVYGRGRGEPHHPGIKVKSFTLGSVRNRGEFIAAEQQDNDVKVTFEHDSKLLTIDFIEKGRKRFPHRMEFHYDDFQQIVLVDYQKSDKASLYLFVNVPPRIRRADSSLVSGNTKWNRTTAFAGYSASVIGNSSVLAVAFEGDLKNTVDKILKRFECSQAFRVYYAKTNIIFDTRNDFVCEHTFSSFETQYAIKSFLSVGRTSSHHCKKLLDEVKRMDEEKTISEEVIQRALYSLNRQLENDYFIDLKAAFLVLVNDEKNNRTKEEVPGRCVYVRRFYCTPTRLIFEQPELMFSNRILRQYGEEFCARIVFRDENYRKLNGTEANSSTDIAKRIIQTLLKGVKIGDRRYKFLACSNSQLRDHGCWLYARDRIGNTGETIRNNMGDFHDIRVVAKYIKRMGQCFSTSESTVEVKVETGQVEHVKDIERNPYCFSDGIGKISGGLRDKVCKELSREVKPSAFQIRYGGYKGVISYDPTLTGEKIILRESMYKFESRHCMLEVMDQSKPGRLFLNKQAITLLSGRGVPDDAFMRLQEDMLYHLANMLLDETNAVKSLKKRVRNGMAFRIISESGISLTREPFFKGMLRTLYRYYIGNLKRKARIEIPDEFGRNMIGTLDESGTLQYGQVFVQYSKDINDPQKETKIHKGPVVITKFPALHPGDIRKFEAVDVPSLHHMIDCVVFPQTGKRPHPDEMAGSDLDGDEYFVTWMPELLIQENVKPMDFPSSPSKKHYSKINEHDMIKYISDYIKNDKVGIISNAHLAFADSEPKGIHSDVCINIAEKFAKAIDFPKTGSCPELEKNEHPSIYPQFMGKRDKASYSSKKVLGLLYDQCQNVESVTWQQDEGSEYRDVKLDEDLISEGYEDYVEGALKTRDEYNHDLKTIMTQYGIEKESEVMSGCLIKLSRRITERNERFDTERLVAEKIRNLRKKYRHIFDTEFENEEQIDIKRMAKASAWYFVTYKEEEPHLGLLSFPWVMSDVLAQIKIPRLGDKTTLSAMQVINKLDDDILNARGKVSMMHGLEATWSLAKRCPHIKSVIEVLTLWDKHLHPRGITLERTKALIQHFSHFAESNDLLSERPSDILLGFLVYLGSFKSRSLPHFNHLPGDPSFIISRSLIQRFSREAERSYHRLALSGTLDCIFGRGFPEGQTEDQFKICSNGLEEMEIQYPVEDRIKKVQKSTGANITFRRAPIGRARCEGIVTFFGSYAQHHTISQIISAWNNGNFITRLETL